MCSGCAGIIGPSAAAFVRREAVSYNPDLMRFTLADGEHEPPGICGTKERFGHG
jgi:hypothetical protein